MKRFLSAGLLFIFLLNLVGLQWIFVHQQNIHHGLRWNWMENEKSEVEVISVLNERSKEVVFVNEHEMLYHGKLYDVDLIKCNGNKTDYYCSADHEEDEMVASFDVIVKNNVSSSATVQSKSVKVLKQGWNEYILDFASHFIESNNIPFSKVLSAVNRQDPFLDSFFIPPDASFAVIAGEAYASLLT